MCWVHDALNEEGESMPSYERVSKQNRLRICSWTGLRRNKYGRKDWVCLACILRMEIDRSIGLNEEERENFGQKSMDWTSWACLGCWAEAFLSPLFLLLLGLEP